MGKGERKTEHPGDSEKVDMAVEPAPEKGAETASEGMREEAWKELLSFTRTRNPVLGSFLAFGDLVQLSSDTIEIGFEKDSFHYERMLEAENRVQLEKIFRDYLKREAKLVISPVGPRVRPKGRAVSDVKTLPQNGAENPLVQETLRLFNGRIVEG